MYKAMRGSLLFPQLVREGEASGGRLEGVPVYRLEWAARDARLRKQHEEWRQQCWPQKDIPWVPALDEAWTAWMVGLRFALNGAYLAEIRRATRAALEEWGLARPFDTVVRDACLEPAEAFVRVAFFLLGDCIYDQETASFARDDRRFLFRFAATYRFWCGQTGHGLLQDLAGFDLLRRSEIHGHAIRTAERQREVDAFLAMIDAQEQRREAAGGQLPSPEKIAAPPLTS